MTLFTHCLDDLCFDSLNKAFENHSQRSVNNYSILSWGSGFNRSNDIKHRSDSVEMEVNNSNTSDAVKLQKLQRWTLEPALFLLFFGWYLSSLIIENQILKQACLYSFDYDYIICTQLDDKNATSIEQEIQPYVANIFMTIKIFSAIIPTTLSLFLGPWSDKYGRKKVINCIFIGFTISMGWITIVSYLSDYIATNNPWNYLFAQLPFMICGGWPTLIIVILCYVTDQTVEENRSIRLTIVELIIFVGVLVAIASSSFLLEATNTTAVFSISFLCISAGTFIVLFFVKETVKVKDNVDMAGQFKEIFTVERVKELFTTCVQRRPYKQRRIIWCLTIILMLTNFTTNGANTVFYLFVRNKFGWNLQDMTLYEATSMLLTVVGSIIGLVVLKKFLKLSDLSLSTLSLASLMIDGVIKTFANQPWQLFLASAVALFKLISGPMLRSIMSTIVTTDEISKVYSITSSIEAISGLGAAPLYSATYSATLSSFPSAFNLITASVFALTLILAVLIARWMSIGNEKDKTIDTRL